MSIKSRKALSAFMAALLLIYVCYQIYLSRKTEIATETAMYSTVSDTIEVQGFAIRDEVVIETQVEGVLDYCVADGDRLSKGNAIANVYSDNESALLQSQMRRLERQIAMLEQMSVPSENYIAEPEQVNGQIYQSLHTIFRNVNRFDFSALSKERDSFQMAVNRKNIATAQETDMDYQPRIEMLQGELEALKEREEAPEDQVEAPEAGYFISQIDGYEQIVEMGDVEGLMPDQVELLLSQPAHNLESGRIGKICNGFNWYIVCVLSEEKAVALERNPRVMLEIPFATVQTVPANVIAKNIDPETGKVAVILSCAYMNEDIARIRNEAITIITNAYEGVLVNEDAIYFNDIEVEETDEMGNVTTTLQKNVKGVYILNGDRIEFVQIFSYKTINGYAICATTLTEEEEAQLYTEHTIGLYDKVVSKAADLYDGKLV